jgi:hypothetical protein
MYTYPAAVNYNEPVNANDKGNVFYTGPQYFTILVAAKQPTGRRANYFYCHAHCKTNHKKYQEGKVYFFLRIKKQCAHEQQINGA